MLLPETPAERNPRYFRTWQRVSIALQNFIRAAAREIYFRDPARFKDRDAAFTLIVFTAIRPFHGRPRSEFTYDLADAQTLDVALHNIGNSLRTALAPLEKRLRESGSLELAHRFAPVWYQDVLVVAKKRPRNLARLIAVESRIIDAVIALGTQRNDKFEKRYFRIADAALRNFHGADMRELIPQILEETARVLSSDIERGGDHVVDGGLDQRPNARAAGRPDSGIGRDEDRDHGRPYRGSQVADPRIVPDIHARRSEPARKLI